MLAEPADAWGQRVVKQKAENEQNQHAAGNRQDAQPLVFLPEPPLIVGSHDAQPLPIEAGKLLRRRVVRCVALDGVADGLGDCIDRQHGHRLGRVLPEEALDRSAGKPGGLHDLPVRHAGLFSFLDDSVDDAFRFQFAAPLFSFDFSLRKRRKQFSTMRNR